jgi:hypothetical protein
MTVSIEHEAPLELCHRHPQLLPKLLDLCGQLLPAATIAEPYPARFNQIAVEEWEADGAMVLRNGQEPVGAVVLEIQRQHDPDKRSSWPLYTAALHAKHRGLLKTYLLVIATNRQTAQWAQQPIVTCQPHAPFRPLVVGPDDVRRLDSEEAARADLPLAMLSAVLHVNDAGGEVDATHALRAADAVGGPEAALWLYGLLRGLVDDERLLLLQEMIKMLNPWANYKPRTQWERDHYNAGVADGETKGEARGEAKALLRILSSRGLSATDAQRHQIQECEDTQQLERWIERALSAHSVSEVLAD